MINTTNKIKTFFLESISQDYDRVRDFWIDLKNLSNKANEDDEFTNIELTGLWYFMGKIGYLAIGHLKNSDFVSMGMKDRLLAEYAYNSAIKFNLKFNNKASNLFLECSRYQYQVLGGLVVTKISA